MIVNSCHTILQGGVMVAPTTKGLSRKENTMSNVLCGYSSKYTGYIVHDKEGNTYWGNHPDTYDGDLRFIRDRNGKVTAIGGTPTDKQKERLDEATDGIPWRGKIRPDDVIVVADDAIDAVTKIGWNLDEASRCWLTYYGPAQNKKYISTVAQEIFCINSFTLS